MFDWCAKKNWFKPSADASAAAAAVVAARPEAREIRRVMVGVAGINKLHPTTRRRRTTTKGYMYDIVERHVYWYYTMRFFAVDQLYTYTMLYNFATEMMYYIIILRGTMLMFSVNVRLR